MITVFFKSRRRYMAEILPIRRKIQYNQSINSHNKGRRKPQILIKAIINDRYRTTLTVDPG